MMRVRLSMPFSITNGARPDAARTPRTISETTQATVNTASTAMQASVFCEAKVANVPASDPIELPPTSVSRVNSPQGIQMKTNSRPYRAR